MRVSTIAALLCALCSPASAAADSAVTVDLGRPQQVIDAFGVNANVHSWHDGELRPAIAAVTDMGASTWRVIIDKADWEATNDDGDPLTFNWDYYGRIYEAGKMADLWNTIAAIESTPGQRVMINAMGDVPDWMGGSRIDAAQEDEWVETMASLVYYGRVYRHLRIDFLGPMNEPDLNGIEGPQVPPDQYVRLLHKLAARLDELGLGSTKLVGPDAADPATAAQDYYPALAADPLVMQHLAAVGIHNYSGSVGGIDGAIAASPFPSTPFWLTEFSTWCDGCDTGAPNPANWDFGAADVDQLFAYLDAGASGAMPYDAWDGYYEHHGSMGYWGLLAYDATNGTYTPRKSYYAIEQVMRYVPRGAVRVTSDVSDGPVGAESFFDESSGRLTIVLRNHSSAAEAVAGAVVGGATGIDSLSSRYTDAEANFASGADVAVDASGRWSAILPADSVETLSGVPSAVPAPPAPPTARITSGPDATTPSTSAAFEFSAADQQAEFECALDGGDWTPCTSPHTVTGLATGPHAFSVRATSASGTGPAASWNWTVTAAPSKAVTLGNDAVENDLDTVDPGMAEAFPVQTGASGTVGALHVYVDSRSNAPRLVAGIYTDDNGHPGRLLAQQSVAAPSAGAWTTMTLTNTTVSAGTRYWLAVLGAGGTLAFRDRIDGGCSSETTASSSLTALPDTWDGGQDWNTCLVSAYASG